MGGFVVWVCLQRVQRPLETIPERLQDLWREQWKAPSVRTIGAGPSEARDGRSELTWTYLQRVQRQWYVRSVRGVLVGSRMLSRVCFYKINISLKIERKGKNQ